MLRCTSLPSPPQLKKRALDQFRLVKPKHAGGSVGDSPEPLLVEPCPGEHAAAETHPGLLTVSGRAPGWRSLGLGDPFCLKGPVEGLPVGIRTPRGLREAPPAGRWATGG